jgi:hypothetical protein
MLKILSNEWTAADNANLFTVFNTPQKSDVTEINIRYGKQILPRTTVNLNFSPSRSNPETNIFKNEGKIIIITMESGIRISSNALKTSDKVAFASSIPFLCRILENRGKKEALKAPSAKILRNVFATLIATSKASE